MPQSLLERLKIDDWDRTLILHSVLIGAALQHSAFRFLAFCFSRYFAS